MTNVIATPNSLEQTDVVVEELKQDAEPHNAKSSTANKSESNSDKTKKAKEINGPRGLEPTRYGDWESKGRCYDF